MNEATKQKQNFEVVVVGAGPFGCFVALLLAQKSVRVALCDPAPQPGASFLHSLQTFWPSLNDPPTRAEVAHGHEMALYLSDFCKRGIETVSSLILPFLAATGFSGMHSAPLLRFGAQEFERVELNKAVELGLGVFPTSDPHVFSEPAGTLYFQNSAQFQNAMVAALSEMGVTYLQGQVLSVQENSHGCEVELSAATNLDGVEGSTSQRLACEQVVLAGAARIGNLLPQYKSILLPMTDFVVEYLLGPANSNASISKFTSTPFSALAFRASSGHASGLFALNEKNEAVLKISGPRFLLPDAGVGVDLSTQAAPAELKTNAQKYAEKVLLPHLKNHIGVQVPSDFLRELSSDSAQLRMGVDCLPCDELPVLGELGRWGRVLGGGGWLGSGFGASCFAAQIISELMMQGSSAHLHPRLGPRRLFVAD